jgi:hypothetical protein
VFSAALQQQRKMLQGSRKSAGPAARMKKPAFLPWRKKCRLALSELA